MAEIIGGIVVGVALLIVAVTVAYGLAGWGRRGYIRLDGKERK